MLCPTKLFMSLTVGSRVSYIRIIIIKNRNYNATNNLAVTIYLFIYLFIFRYCALKVSTVQVLFFLNS